MGANEKYEATYHGYTPKVSHIRGAYVHTVRREVGLDEAQARFDRWLEAVRAEAKAEALDEAVSDFESNVGVGEFAEQSRDGETFWRHVAEAWEAQGPYMQWLRNRADQIKAATK